MQLKTQYKKPVKSPLENWEALPDSANVRLPVVMAIYGVSKGTIYNNCRKGAMPSPFRASERCSVWNVGAIRADLAAKAAVHHD